MMVMSAPGMALSSPVHTSTTELAISLLMLVVSPVASQLGHRPPPAPIWPVVLLAPVVLVGVDAAEKRWTARHTR